MSLVRNGSRVQEHLFRIDLAPTENSEESSFTFSDVSGAGPPRGDEGGQKRRMSEAGHG